MKILKTLQMGIILAMLSPFFVSAQIPDPVSFRFSDVPDEVKAGDVFNIIIDADIEEKWHLYSILNDPDAGPFPTKISANSSNFVIAGTIEESQAEVQFDPNFEAELGLHSHSARFIIPVAVKTSFQGNQDLDIQFFYQTCDDRLCLPPKKKSVIVPVSVTGVSAAPYEEAGDETISQELNKKVSEGAAKEGFFSFIWIALTAGFIALLTPCVFPMIPLTVSYFSKQQDDKKGVKQALLFGIAIVLTFTILGVLLAIIIGASGAAQFASNPWVNLFIGIILVAFALSLLGMFELQLPHQFTNYLNKKSNESSGIIGILFMAMTISAVSFSCTAPFVGGVLAATAGGEWFYPIIGMIAFSSAFASPFVIFAMFPKWLESLPKSGSWMNVVKVLLGFVELAAAFKFFSNADLVWSWGLISRPFAIAAWIVIFLLAGFYVLGIFALKHEQKPESISAGRLIISMPLLLFSFYLIPGLLGASLGIWDAWLPPKQVTDVSVVASISVPGGSLATENGWSEDYEAVLENARRTGKPVFIDFTGYTCTNCRAMETNVFPLAGVQEQFKQMELVRLYTDGGADASKNQMLQFELTGNVALPTYVILDPNTNSVIVQILGYTDKEKFTSFLKKGLDEFKLR